jgi:hypothetical protein
MRVAAPYEAVGVAGGKADEAVHRVLCENSFFTVKKKLSCIQETFKSDGIVPTVVALV